MGISAITFPILSASFQPLLPIISLNLYKMLLRRLSSNSGLRPPPPKCIGPIFCVSIRKRNPLRCLCLDPIAVHVDNFRNAFRQILLIWRRQFRLEEVQENRELLPFRVHAGQDRR